MEHDLNKLAGLKVPATGEKAKGAAVLAAMVAFDDAVEEKNAVDAQGSASGVRPTSIVNKLWSTIMNSAIKPIWTMKPATMAALTGVCLLPLAGVVALNVYEPPQTLDLKGGELKTAKDALGDDDGTLRRDAITGAGKLKSARELGARVQQGASVSETRPVEKAEELRRSEADTQLNVAPNAPTSTKQLANEGAKPMPGATANAEVLSDAQNQPVQRIAPARKMRSREFSLGFAVPKGGASGIVAPQPLPRTEPSRERYAEFDDNSTKAVAQHPVSTFSIDVDTASYSRVRRALMSGNLPSKDMVRVEELINYFNYDLPTPEDRAQPFKPSVKITQNPWNAATQLLHVGIKGFDVPRTEQPKANLVFLLDVSGSMNQPDKLPLLIKSFGLLLQKLNPDDTVSIVTYAGRAGTVLEPTKASDKTAILDALNNLRAGGSTGGAQGIEQAYKLAKKSFVEGGVNRVMLATDGDFNVGISDPKQLKNFIANKRKEGVFLSVFGFGRGNYNDALMQSLAQNGNGQAAYIDTLAEAQKSLVEEAGATLFPIAKDVKIQIEFDPAKVAEYRLIGYETRALKREDFNNDKVDAGDIGAGHSISASYELVPARSPAVSSDPLRYSAEETKISDNPYGEVGFLKMRYKLPNESKSRLISEPIINPDNRAVKMSYDGAFPPELRFASAVAAFGQKLRGNAAVDDMTFEDIADLAANARGDDKFGYRSAFVQLVRMAGSLSGNK